MNITNYYQQYFKPVPLGLKSIIAIYGIAVFGDIIDLITGFSWGGIFGLFLSIVFFAGFLFRWEALRVFTRFIIGFFFVAMVYEIVTSEKFRAIARENAIYWSIGWIIPIIIFFYLGRPKIKDLFRKREEIEASGKPAT